MTDDIRRALASPTISTTAPTAARQVIKRRSVTPSKMFEPLPAPAGVAPYRRALVDVLTPAAARRIEHDQVLRFHCVGDSGGWRHSRPQREVADAMVGDLRGTEPPQFFFHLGDLVYPHGEEANYGAQFFAPYAAYHAPIFAIPGNHDGEVTPGSRHGSLHPFVKTFCAATPPLHDASVPVRRPLSRQPHVHWTLTHDWLWIIGLYTNVHEDGEISAAQLQWLTGELSAAPSTATLIVAVHRPVYSVDVVHGSNLDLGDAFDACFARAGRAPDAVLSAHCHNYQRFSRRLGGRRVPYVVAGSGGFYERHAVGIGIGRLPARFTQPPDVTLESYQCDRHGYLTVSVTPAGGEAVYSTVSDAGAAEYDRFSFGPGVHGGG